jgi:hypothetical protein
LLLSGSWYSYSSWSIPTLTSSIWPRIPWHVTVSTQTDVKLHPCHHQCTVCKKFWTFHVSWWKSPGNM